MHHLACTLPNLPAPRSIKSLAGPHCNLAQPSYRRQYTSCPYVGPVLGEDKCFYTRTVLGRNKRPYPRIKPKKKKIERCPRSDNYHDTEWSTTTQIEQMVKITRTGLILLSLMQGILRESKKEKKIRDFTVR